MKKPQNILVSGASSGIGKSLALCYARSGVNLFLCGRNQERLSEVKELCQIQGANVLIKNFDVTNELSAKNFVDEIEESYPIDLVIANAGISGGKSGDEAFEDVQKIISTNINGVLNLIHPAIEKMKQRKKGQIAIISSLASFSGIPSSPAYSASKAAVRIYAEGLRGNLAAFGIEVSAICPGYVESQMTENNKFWMPFLMSSKKAAKIIKRGLEKNKSRIAFPFLLYFVVWFLALLPKNITDFIFQKIAERNRG